MSRTKKGQSDKETKEITRQLRKEQRQKEQEIFHQLKGIKKLKHFLTYYRAPVIGVLATIFVVVSMIFAVKNGTGKIGLYCVLFTESTEDYDSWGTGLLSHVEQVEGDRFFEQLAYFIDEDDMMKGTAESYLATRIGVREADVMIGGDYFVKYTGDELDVLMPLDEAFGEEWDSIKNQYPDKIKMNSNGAPCAIELTEKQLPETSVRPYYVTICSATVHLEQSKELLKIILG